MVGVRLKQLSAIGLALVLSTAPAGIVSAQTGDEGPACVPADDGSDDLICQPPDECLNGTNTSDCEPPPECQPLEDGTYRCDPPDDADANTTDGHDATANETDWPGLLTSEGAPAEPGPPVVDCRPANGTRELVCQQHPGCEGSDHPSCRPPSRCEPVGPGHYRCLPEQAAGAQQNASQGSSGSSSGTAQDTEGTRSHEGPASMEPTCRAGSQPGTIACEPPEECQGRIGETQACTPPPTCQRRSDGTFVCQIPERAGTSGPNAGDATGQTNASGSARADADAGSASVPEGQMPDESPFQRDLEEARAQARVQIAEGLEQAVQEFRGDLDTLKAEYKERLDGLRAEFRDTRDELREEYRHCRAAITENASGEEKVREPRSCLDEARQGLEDLEAEMKDRYDDLNTQFEKRIEQARTEACTQAELSAVDAVAENGLFSDNPADLLPDRALELCPSFATFDSQTGGGST